MHEMPEFTRRLKTQADQRLDAITIHDNNLHSAADNHGDYQHSVAIQLENKIRDTPRKFPQRYVGSIRDCEDTTVLSLAGNPRREGASSISRSASARARAAGGRWKALALAPIEHVVRSLNEPSRATPSVEVVNESNYSYATPRLARAKLPDPPSLCLLSVNED